MEQVEVFSVEVFTDGGHGCLVVGVDKATSAGGVGEGDAVRGAVWKGFRVDGEGGVAVCCPGVVEYVTWGVANAVIGGGVVVTAEGVDEGTGGGVHNFNSNSRLAIFLQATW